MLPADIFEGTNLVHVAFFEDFGTWDIFSTAENVQTDLMYRICKMCKLQILNRSPFLNKIDLTKLLKISKRPITSDLIQTIVSPHDIIIILNIHEFIMKRC